MKNYKSICIVIISFFTILSCDDYLDVSPDNQFLEEDLFNDEISIQNALNGLYLKATSTNLYGGHLSFGTIDILGSLYFTGNNTVGIAHDYRRYREISSIVRDHPDIVDGIWSDAYKAIRDINNFIENMDLITSNVVSDSRKNIMVGEAHALRAMIHFDLLRLYGPVYKTSSTEEAIPYVDKVSIDLPELLSAEKVMEKIIADLQTAEEFLKNDPIIDLGVDGESNHYFYANRQARLNYYAIKGLQARAYMYAGDKVNAFNMAKTVIDVQQQRFPWTPHGEVFSQQNEHNTVFYSEVLFALPYEKLIDKTLSYFSFEKTGNNILSTRNNILDHIYENELSDHRYGAWFKTPERGQLPFKTFRKYQEIISKRASGGFSVSSLKFYNKLPLLRISEMYYIAAEATTEGEDIAFGYLNTVRKNRGLQEIEIGSGAILEDEIKKEYQKEFYGEGQTFFYYKRVFADEIPDLVSDDNPSWTKNMAEEDYVMPLPDFEIKFREKI